MNPTQVIKSTVKKIEPVRKFIQQRRVNSHFPQEVLLLNDKHKSNSSHQSIVFFTLHKCASVYVKKILFELAEDVNITPIDLAGYFWRSAKSPKLVENQVKRAFKPVGYLYGPFRTINLFPEMKDVGGYGLIDNIENYKILLMVRDPRDILTSKYFSDAYSHLIPELRKEKMLADRENFLKVTVDEFVTDENRMKGFLRKYTEYSQELLGRPNVLFVKYEDLVNNFEAWLNNVIEYLKLDVNQETVKKLIEQANFKVDQENVHSHKRQVTPGDHKRKLKPESIDILNSEFGEVLDLFGYER